MTTIHFNLADSAGDNREGTAGFSETSGRVSLRPYYSTDDALLLGHDYTISIAIELPNGNLSPWSDPVPVTQRAVANQITQFGFLYANSPQYLAVDWEMADENPVMLDIETRINGSAWIPTTTVSSGYAGGSAFLRNSESQLLDETHGFLYSDGTIRHIEARVRIQQATEWIEAPPVDVPLVSAFRPKLNYWDRILIHNEILPFPRIGLKLPDDYRYDLWLSVDDGPQIFFASLVNPIENSWKETDFLKKVPNNKFDGNTHNIEIGAFVLKNDEPKSNISIDKTTITLPNISNVIPFLYPKKCTVYYSADAFGTYQWNARLEEMPDFKIIMRVFDNDREIFPLVGGGLGELHLLNIDLPADGRLHRLTLIYCYEIPVLGRTSNVVTQHIEVMTMAANAPSNVMIAYKKVKDQLSNLQTGYEFTARLSFDQNKLKIQSSIDDGAYTDCTFSVLSNFPPMIRINGVTVPRDAYSHPVTFKLWHEDAVNGDSPAVITDPVVAVFDMAPPPAPTNVVATVVRNRTGIVPDQVRVQWASDFDVDIILLDDQGKRRQVGSGAEADSELVVEGCSRFGTQDGVSHAFRFGVQSTNRSASSPIVYADPVNLTTTNTAVVAQSPDDIAGTAQYLSHAQFIEWLKAAFPAIDPASVNAIFTSALNKIKDVVAKGGSVTLSDVGIFKAQWTEEKTAFRNGQYITIPPVRNADFALSLGFQKGTKLGQMMSDTEAALV